VAGSEVVLEEVEAAAEEAVVEAVLVVGQVMVEALEQEVV
jgi:hypothetical protein